MYYAIYKTNISANLLQDKKKCYSIVTMLLRQFQAFVPHDLRGYGALLPILPVSLIID